MYLNEICEIIEDSHTGRVSEVNSHLKVLGNNGLKSRDKKAIVFCSICVQDKEMFGDGVFITTISSFNNGINACGCSSTSHKSEQQYAVVVRRILESKGFEFLGWDGEYRGDKLTRYVSYCKDHGYFGSTIRIIINHKGCCQLCGWQVRKSDQEWVDQFKSTNAFPTGTEFTRIARTSDGNKNIWSIHCPICKKDYQSTSTVLARGSSPCHCNRNQQKYAYIMLITDGDTPYAIKFGISSVPSKRLKEQRGCVKGFIIDIIGIWRFKSREDCWAAELKCKRVLECNFMKKFEMVSGYTETTSILNYDNVVSIYEYYGGVRENVEYLFE